MRLFSNIFTIAFVFALINMANAQQNKNEKHNEQVTIVGSYDPSINDAFKINSKPKIIEPEIQQTEFNFQLPDTRQTTSIKLNPIKAVTLRSGSKSVKYDNFLKAGFGSRISPYIDFYHSKTEKGNYSFNANLYHYSSFKNIKDYSASPMSNTHAKVGYQKFMNNHILDLGLNYGMKTNRFYGYVPSDWGGIDIPESELRQMFNLIKANVGVSSNYKRKSKLHHDINLSAYYYFDLYKTSEMNANVSFDLHQGFDVVDMLDYQNLGLKGGFQFYGNNDSLNNTSEFYVNAVPYFTANYGVFNFNAGLNFGIKNDSSTSFHFWPEIEVQMNVVPGSFTIFAGIDGKLQKQSFYDLTTENPYLSPVAELRWLKEKFNVFGGFKLSIAQNAGFQLKTGWKTFEDMAFFVNTGDYTLPSLFPLGPLNKFFTVYDNGSRFYTEASISVRAGKNFKLNIGGEYNAYNLDSLNKAYHKPLTKAFVGGSYLFGEKAKVSAELIFNGKRYARDIYKLADIELDPYIDLNAEFEYRVDENLAVFINGTNLLNNNYLQFYSYPVQGFQIMAGITYRF
ncbi:MAG: TonB-dependent receptor [Chlorobi bacterium]|nr:TonB-dependent receptor [Chlorobiota bacterium]